MLFRLDNKLALVTGGTTGLGRAYERSRAGRAEGRSPCFA